MNSLKKYDIAFRSLKVGTHTFEYDIDKMFFEAFNDEQKGKLHTIIEVKKENHLITLNFTIKGYIITVCDRCLDELNLSISYNGYIYIRFGEHTEEYSHDTIILSNSDDYINVSQYIYEFIKLSIPIRNVHNEEGKNQCNKEMLNKINNLNKTKINQIDPRWETLKKLINKTN